MTLPIPQEPLGNGERVHSSIVSIQLGSLWLLKELGQASCPLAAAQWYTGCNSPSWTLHSWPRSHLCPLRTSNEAEPSKQTARQHSLAGASPVGKQLERRHSSLTMLLFKKKQHPNCPTRADEGYGTYWIRKTQHMPWRTGAWTLPHLGNTDSQRKQRLKSRNSEDIGKLDFPSCPKTKSKSSIPLHPSRGQYQD